MIRYFSTPAQKSNYSNQTSCSRLCGQNMADHFHIFWGFPSVAPFWKELHKVREAEKINLDFKSVYFGDWDNTKFGKVDSFFDENIVNSCQEKKVLLKNG